GALPASAEPVAGMAFVRCTSLWTALPDGSAPRRILEATAIGWPTFSPDGRSIAFVAERPGGPELWVAAADGSRVEAVGPLGGPGLSGRVGGLAWSPDGRTLAFAVAEGDGLREIWALDLGTGVPERVGVAGGNPAWIGGALVAAEAPPGDDLEILAGDRRERWTVRRMSSPGIDLAGAASPGWWVDGWRHDTAVLREEGSTVELVVRPWKDGVVPPEGWRIDPDGGLAVLEGGPVAVTLQDGTGEPSLGLFDPTGFGGWTIRRYAWNPAWSPAPPLDGRPEAARALSLVRQLVWRWDEPAQARLVVAGYRPGLVRFDDLGAAFGRPDVRGATVAVPTTAFGRLGDAFAFRRIAFLVGAEDGRAVVRVGAAGPIRRIRTVADAVRFLDRTLTVPVLAPAGLPAGTRLARNAVDAWSWRGRTEGSLNLSVPTPGGRATLTVRYGSAGFGCGPSPVPIELPTGTPAIATDPSESGTYSQVAWPSAGPRDLDAPFSLSGELPREQLIAIAAAMDAARLASGR
ncbi:MAG TPA: hypothetical protein VNO79_05405, partial [Actinomycetota bacterium]|nr:hypothetical protein [Actinomycetota bacterium]